MPRTNCNYAKTIIYKIVCNNLNITDCYVGHTTDFTRRKGQHKFCCTTENDKAHNFNVYTFIRANGGWINWTMLEIQKFPCADGNEARTIERYWFEQLNATLNSEVPNRTDAELLKYKKDHYEANKDEIKIKHKEYRATHQDAINKKCVCQCGGKFTNSNKGQHLKSNKHQDYINSLV
jgi:hypothetical protein